MVGKVLCNRERGKPQQILKPPLPAQHYTALDTMEEAAADSVSGQTDIGTILTDANPKSLDLKTHCSLENDRKLSSVHFHIKVLYTTIICLTLVLVLSLTLCYFQINALNKVVSCQLTSTDSVEFKIPVRGGANHDLQMPYITPEDELNLGGFWEGGEFSENSESKMRSKRQTRFYEGSGDAEDWLWMSSFARVPVSDPGCLH